MSEHRRVVELSSEEEERLLEEIWLGFQWWKTRPSYSEARALAERVWPHRREVVNAPSP